MVHHPSLIMHYGVEGNLMHGNPPWCISVHYLPPFECICWALPHPGPRPQGPGAWAKGPGHWAPGPDVSGPPGPGRWAPGPGPRALVPGRGPWAQGPRPRVPGPGPQAPTYQFMADLLFAIYCRKVYFVYIYIYIYISLYIY